jgi:hypothetical protein
MKREECEIICEVCGGNNWSLHGIKIKPMTGDITEIRCNKCYNRIYYEHLYADYLKKVMSILHRDGVIDCNQYQGGDFNDLFNRIREDK